VKGELHGCPQLKEVEKMQCIEAGYVVAPNKIGVLLARKKEIMDI
jgi:hypothetical protein